MRHHSLFILNHVSRFGGLRYSQLEALCHGVMKKTYIYRQLKVLRQMGLIMFHDTHDRRGSAIVCTEEGRKRIFGDEYKGPKTLRLCELDHTLACAETVIALYHRPWIVGVATEFELYPKDLDGIIQGRTPDALAVLRQGTNEFRVAIEVETSLRSIQRIKDVLFHYRQTFEAQSPCAVVIIVCCEPSIYRRYRAEMNEVPKDLWPNFLIVDSPVLPSLPSTAFGERLNHVNSSANRSWHSFTSEYLSFAINPGTYPDRPLPKSDARQSGA